MIRVAKQTRLASVDGGGPQKLDNVISSKSAKIERS